MFNDTSASPYTLLLLFVLFYVVRIGGDEPMRVLQVLLVQNRKRQKNILHGKENINRCVKIYAIWKTL